MSKYSIHNSDIPEVLAGVVGFEPTIFSTKNCCLTTWPHPISERLSNVSCEGAQEGFGKKDSSFFAAIYVAAQSNCAAGLKCDLAVTGHWLQGPLDTSSKRQNHPMQHQVFRLRALG